MNNTRFMIEITEFWHLPNIPSKKKLYSSDTMVLKTDIYVFMVCPCVCNSATFPIRTSPIILSLQLISYKFAQLICVITVTDFFFSIGDSLNSAFFRKTVLLLLRLTNFLFFCSCIHIQLMIMMMMVILTSLI